jgi:hypothetical protein
MADIIVETLGKEIAEHAGGIVHTNFLIAPLEWFETIGAPKVLSDTDTPANEGTTFAELATITTAHTFKTGKGFMTLTSAIETSDIKSAYLGESTNKVVENKSTLVLEDSDAEILGFSRWIKNKRVIVLQQEVGSKNYRQLGSEEFGAIATELDAMVEGAREGLNRRTFTFSDKQRYEAPIYNATVTKVPTA